MQKEGCSPGLEKGTWWGEGRAFRSLENTGISIATLYHFWQHLGQAVEVCSAVEVLQVCSTDEASSRGGQVAPGEVAPVVAASVQTGNNKIAAYGAAVQRFNGDRPRVLQAIVDGKLYISYWEFASGRHESGMEFVLQTRKLKLESQRAKPANMLGSSSVEPSPVTAPHGTLGAPAGPQA